MYVHTTLREGSGYHRARTLPPTNARPFNIGQASSRSGVTAKMIRHYESLGLLPSVSRTAAGYRLYGENEVHMLRFIGRTRNLGFGLDEIAKLLKLWQNRRRASADVERIALVYIVDLDLRVEQLLSIKHALEALIESCHGDGRDACPVFS